MIGSVNTGGGAKAFAFIVVTYPAGSVCTCTDGMKTLRAKNTTGTWVFDIPYAGTWTVSCTNGSETASASVVISAKGQSETVGLSYRKPPAEYQAVDYIKSTGTQYIATNIYFQNKMKLIADCMWDGSHSTTEVLASARDSNLVRLYSIYGSSMGGTTLSLYRGSTAIFDNHTGSTIQLQKYHIESNVESGNLYVKRDGETVLSSDATYADFTMTANMLLFHEEGAANLWGKVRLYSATIYNNGELVRDFVPCYRKSDNVAGLWDMVSKTFFTNKGSGTFVVGEPI